LLCKPRSSKESVASTTVEAATATRQSKNVNDIFIMVVVQAMRMEGWLCAANRTVIPVSKSSWLAKPMHASQNGSPAIFTIRKIE
jgi:hypothetical protein